MKKSRSKKRSKLKDWTMDGRGCVNNSERYLSMVDQVEMLIVSSASALIGGHANQVARLIMSQLAHVHKFGPK